MTTPPSPAHCSTHSLIASPVLVLNQNYEPLNITSAKRALNLVMASKAEVLETARGSVNSPSTSIRCPSVIRLHYMVRRPKRSIPLSRREIFLRDDYTCQYCGTRARNLTLDHVIPRSKGGKHTWDNLVSACGPCNHAKGRRTVEQARMHLRTLPREPRHNPYSIARRWGRGELADTWPIYLPGEA
jgi:5-methylcytosine-specific restriction endonuclease McrA